MDPLTRHRTPLGFPLGRTEVCKAITAPKSAFTGAAVVVIGVAIIALLCPIDDAIKVTWSSRYLEAQALMAAPAKDAVLVPLASLCLRINGSD